jgi:hypothetical protein
VQKAARSVVSTDFIVFSLGKEKLFHGAAILKFSWSFDELDDMLDMRYKMTVLKSDKNINDGN